MTNFAAIDFETANYNPSSVCSVGLVIVRDGKIAEKIYCLIHPSPNYYNWFTSIHGLSDADTCNAPNFPEVWNEITPRIAGLPLVAHNSPFDEKCLRAVHRVYQMDYPDYVFHCTCCASRQTFGKKLANHQLHTVAAHCGYDLQNHHHALADAEACAEIAMKIL
jgi:DNA polymerase-3 subunit epsilon